MFSKNKQRVNWSNNIDKKTKKYLISIEIGISINVFEKLLSHAFSNSNH